MQHNIGSPSHSNQTKEIKSIQIGREEVKIVHSMQMTYYIEKTLRTPHKNYLTNEFSKVAAYKISIQKSVAFLYTNYEILEKEYKNTILLKLHPKSIEVLWR